MVKKKGSHREYFHISFFFFPSFFFFFFFNAPSFKDLKKNTQIGLWGMVVIIIIIIIFLKKNFFFQFMEVYTEPPV